MPIALFECANLQENEELGTDEGRILSWKQKPKQ